MGMTIAVQHRILGLLLLAAAALCAVAPARAQEVVPRVEEAEVVFEQALDAFEAGDYGMAYRRFRLVYSTYALNRKTTAAMLMAGKALYRNGEYERAAELLLQLMEEYPSSSYAGEARRVRDFALQMARQERDGKRIQNLGIILPLGQDDATLTQSLFTGIRIAVDEHNRLNPEVPIRMIFRDTRSEPNRVGALVGELGEAGVEAIIGPLYSDEAMAAASAAEQHDIVLIPPLANDEAVSQGRDYVFQANPTISTRGRLMAQFAMRGLLLDDFGIIAEQDPGQISERMAEGFQEVLVLNGEDVHFYKVLPSRGDWRRLSEIIGADTLRRASAVYMPIAGGESISRIDAALSSLDQMGVQGRVRVLGNTEWHNIPSAVRASRYNVTYTNDFYVVSEDASVRAFVDAYRDIIGREPDPSQTVGRLAFTGYDVARFLIAQMIREGGSLLQRIRSAPAYQGLGLRIDFSKGNVNEALYYFRYQDGRARLLR